MSCGKIEKPPKKSAANSKQGLQQLTMAFKLLSTSEQQQQVITLPREKVGLHSDGESCPGDSKQLESNYSNPNNARKKAIERCIQWLEHACQCRDANCQLGCCQKMKRVVTHTKICKMKMNSGCPICKQLIALCCFHAKHCQETKCPVPFCLNIRHKLEQQQTLLHMPPGQGAGNLLPMDQWQRYPGPAQCLHQTGPQMGNTWGPLPSGLQQQANSGVGVQQPATPLFTPSANRKQVLQQLMMALKSPSTAEQQQQILHILKANPQLMAAFIKQRQQTHGQAIQCGSTSVAGNASRQLPYMSVQQQQSGGQHLNRMQAQNLFQSEAGWGASDQEGMQEDEE